MSELEAFKSILDRCGIRHSDWESDGATTVNFSPDYPNDDDVEKISQLDE